MTTSDKAPVAVFTPGERRYISPRARSILQLLSVRRRRVLVEDVARRSAKGSAKAAAGSQEPD